MIYGSNTLYGVLNKYRTGNLTNTTYSLNARQWKRNDFSPRHSRFVKTFLSFRLHPTLRIRFPLSCAQFLFQVPISLCPFTLISTQLSFLTFLLCVNCLSCFKKKWNFNPDKHNCTQEPLPHFTSRFGFVETSTNSEGPAYCGLGNEPVLRIRKNILPMKEMYEILLLGM